MPHTYEKDGAAIYKESFSIIRAESDLARFDADEEQVAVRMIHAAGSVELAPRILFSPGMVASARRLSATPPPTSRPRGLSGVADLD